MASIMGPTLFQCVQIARALILQFWRQTCVQTRVCVLFSHLREENRDFFNFVRKLSNDSTGINGNFSKHFLHKSDQSRGTKLNLMFPHNSTSAITDFRQNGKVGGGGEIRRRHARLTQGHPTNSVIKVYHRQHLTQPEVSVKSSVLFIKLW